MTGLIIDNFAGGGGASTGIEAALGRAVDIAINHDEQAIRMHEVEHNLQAIYHILDARRTEMRHGGLHIVRQTFKGFVALPAPAGQRPWREVLDLAGPVTAAQIDAAYRDKAVTAHPDKGGSTEVMSALNRARAEAKATIA
ncbi:MAG: hypothetical protein KGM49_09435 [Sphingomonadales bacterium]|nr:hypothetical protein [Sphingomonadales bacterium]